MKLDNHIRLFLLELLSHHELRGPWLTHSFGKLWSQILPETHDFYWKGHDEEQH